MKVGLIWQVLDGLPPTVAAVRQRVDQFASPHAPAPLAGDGRVLDVGDRVAVFDDAIDLFAEIRQGLPAGVGLVSAVFLCQNRHLSRAGGPVFTAGAAAVLAVGPRPRGPSGSRARRGATRKTRRSARRKPAASRRTKP